MPKRIPLIFRHILYNLRGGFLLRPLAIALTLGFIGGGYSWLEQVFPAISAWVPRWLFPQPADPGVVQVLFQVIATATMTVVSIVFAILLMTLTLASMQFSPRILVNFSRDRSTQWTLGIFLGTFCYCIAALPAARNVPQRMAPSGTAAGAMMLALCCVACLLYFIHHISHAISVNYIVDRIATETLAVIDGMMPHPRRGQSPLQQPPELSAITWDATITVPTAGYIRFIDVNQIFNLSESHRVRCRITRRVGHFIPEGFPLLEVSRGDRLASTAPNQFRKCFDIGPSRTLQQDAEFGVLQIVDIALRAISPAVNDPTTAINCIDQLSRILIRYGSREEPATIRYSLPGEARLIVDWITFDGLLHTAFDQISHYGAGDAPVRLRLLRACHDIAVTCRHAAIRQAVLKQAQVISSVCKDQHAADAAQVTQARIITNELLEAIDRLTVR